jgi:hypothetical protein
MPRLFLCMLALTACHSDPVVLEGSPGAERLFGSIRPATRATYVGTCVGGVAPGAPGDVSLCRGEDWWLPASVAPSTEGTVTAYSAPVDEEVADPTLWTNPYTRRLSGSDPHVLIGSAVDLETGDIDYSLKRLLYNYAEYDCVDAWVDDCMDTTGASEGSCKASTFTALDSSSPFIEAGAATQYGSSGEYFACPDPRGWEDSRRRIGLTNWGTETGTSMDQAVEDLGYPSFEDRLDEWLAEQGLAASDLSAAIDGEYSDGGWATTLDFMGEEAYEPIADSYAALAQALDVYDPYQQVDAVQINGEGGLWPYFNDAGITCVNGLCDGDELASVEEVVQWHGKAALASGLAADRWMVNIAMGGAEFTPWVDLAASEGMGLASHGPSVAFNYRFLQHLDHVAYDEKRKAFRAEGDHGFSFLHTDLENLDHTGNTWGQYRGFRLAALSALSLRFDRLLVTSYTIPSLGIYQDNDRCDGKTGLALERCENYDHDAIAAEGAVDFLDWMQKSIGRHDEEAVEAWCAPVELGHDGGEGQPFEERRDMASDETLRFSSDPSVYSPLRTYLGHGCDLSDSEDDRGNPGVEMTTRWTDPDGTGESPEVSSDATFDHRMLSGQATGTAFPYEGRTTEGMASKRLVMDLDPELFQRSHASVAVKLVLRARGTITPLDPTQLGVRLYDLGTSFGDFEVIDLSGKKMGSDQIFTLTVSMDPGVSLPAEPKLAVSHRGGTHHVDVLMARVIPVP